jgi:hypothetical protein
MSKHDQGYQALTAAGSDDTTIGWSIPAGDREGFGRKPKPALIAPIRRYSHSFHAGAGTDGQPISTTHPDPGRIVNRKSCNFTIAATRLRPRPRPAACRTLSDR